MTKIDAQALWANAKANANAWRACVGPHDLEGLTPSKTFGKRFRCRLCGGECVGIAKSYYEQGLRHGRGV